MNRAISWLLLSAASLILTACGSGNSYDAPAAAPPPAPASTMVRGVVTDDFVSGATVNAYIPTTSSAPFSSPGALIAGPVTTDANGNYSLNLGSYSGPVLLESTGGTFNSNGTQYNLANDGFTLMTLLPNVTSGSVNNAQITPLTTVAAQFALTLINSTTTPAAAATEANADIAYYFGLTDIVQTALLNLGTADCAAAASQASADASLVIASIPQLAAKYGVSPIDLGKAIALDFESDGLIDGLNNGAPILVGPNSVPLTTIEGATLGQTLATIINTFESSAANVCNAQASTGLMQFLAEPAPPPPPNDFEVQISFSSISGLPAGDTLGFKFTYMAPSADRSLADHYHTFSVTGSGNTISSGIGFDTGYSETDLGSTWSLGFSSTVPAGLTCSINPSAISGNFAANTNPAVINNVVVSCSANAYSVGGVVSNLQSGASLTLTDSVSGTSATVTGQSTVNPQFTLDSTLAYGAAYDVTVAAASDGQACTFSPGGTTEAKGNISANVSLVVSCATAGGGNGTTPSVYIVDSTSTLFAFDANGNVLGHVALSTPVNNLNGGGITTDANNVYVNVGATATSAIDHTPGAVLAFDKTTLAPVTLPTGSFSNINTPRGIIFDAHNSQFYIGNGASNVTVYNATGGYLSDITSAVYGPSGVAYDSVDHTIWVANDTNGNGANPTYGISEFNENGTLAQTINESTQFQAPIQPTHVLPYSIGYCAPSAGGAGGAAVVAVGFLQDNINQDPQGTLGVSEGAVYTPTGAMVGAFSPQLAATAQPNSISCSSSGSIYVAANDGLHIYATSGAGIALPSGGFTGLTAPLFGVYANY